MYFQTFRNRFTIPYLLHTSKFLKIIFQFDSLKVGSFQGPPQPYNFEYNAADEEGNKHYRNEQGDQNGNVKGTYGYNDVQGLYRIVEYVADENGFRVNIKTNEPGVDDKESPADVVLTAEKPPAGIGGASSGRAYRSAGPGSNTLLFFNICLQNTAGNSGN